jgi:hypothetical protein
MVSRRGWVSLVGTAPRSGCRNDFKLTRAAALAEWRQLGAA